LIKEEGEDIEYEFYYEQKPVQLNQTVFEIIKDQASKPRVNEKAAVHVEQMRVLKEREDDLKRRAKELASLKDQTPENQKQNEEKIAQLKKEHDMIKEIFNQIQKQFDAEQSASQRYGGPPPGFLSSFANAHKIFFRIKEKTDEVAGIGRSREDSLNDATIGQLKR